MQKLPVFQAFKEVYVVVFSRFFALLRVAWLPLILYYAISISANLAFSGTDALLQGIVGILVILLQIVFSSIASVNFHRFVLLGETKRGKAYSGIAFDRIEKRYIWCVIKMIVGVLAIALVCGIFFAISAILFRDAIKSELDPRIIAGLAVVGFIIGVFVLSAIWRLSFIFPHVALGHYCPIADMWEETRGNATRIFFCFLLIALTATIGSVAIVAPLMMSLGIPWSSLASPAPNPGFEQYLMLIAGVLIQLVTMLVSITALSIAYREILGAKPAENSGE